MPETVENPPAISVRELRYSFDEGTGRKEVLHGIDVDFWPGEIVIIMGPSGSGKSTLLKLIGGQRSLQHGSIRVDGHELAGVSQKRLVQLRRHMGFIFQSHHLLAALTACQNVQMPLSFDARETASSSRGRALKILERVGLSEHVDKKPATLSGGQKQRVAIARALVNHPRIILADEPTASLDSKTGREVVDLIQQLACESRCAIVLVTHDPRILDVADRLIHLEDGCLKEPEIALQPSDAAKALFGKE